MSVLRATWLLGIILVAAPQPALSREITPSCTQPSERGCPIDPGHWVHGVLVEGDDIHRYNIRVDVAPNHLRALLTELPRDYDLHLISPAGVEIGRSTNEDTNDDFITVEVEDRGDYALYVNAGRGIATGRGWYKLMVEVGPLPELPDPSLSTVTLHAWWGDRPIAGAGFYLDDGTRGTTDESGQVVFKNVSPGYRIIRTAISGPNNIFSLGFCCGNMGNGLHVRPGQHVSDAVYFHRTDLRLLEPPDGTVKARPTLRWQAYDRAETYDVWVFRLDDSGAMRGGWVATTPDLSFTVNRDLEPGRTYRWFVEAMDRFGHVIGSARRASTQGASFTVPE